jgi:nicotinamide mononucleotide (NMN) deamidase PncC
MVCFGWIVRGRPPRTATLHLPGDRAAVRDASVDAALSGLLEVVGEVPL